MDDTTLFGIIAVIVILQVILFLTIIFKKPKELTDFSLFLQNSNQLNQQQQTQIALLSQKLVQLDVLQKNSNEIQIELAKLAEKILKIETNQNQTSQGIGSINTNLTETGTVTKTLVDTANAIRTDLTNAKNDLTKIQTRVDERKTLDEQTAVSIKRLEAIIAGIQTKGVAGENILDFVFAKLPVEWQVRNFKIGNKSVEFGIKLPNDLILPIDSKWPATNLLEQFLETDDPTEQQKLKSQIERIVMDKGTEVKKYIDPAITVNFGIAVVPDAIYDLCYGILVDLFEMNVVLVSYSQFMSYLLLVYQTMQKVTSSIDFQKLDAQLHNAQKNIQAMNDELEGRFSKGITMLTNSKSEMSAHVSRLNSSLSYIQICTNAEIKDIKE
jgi:DNA recombination protein RmuC